MRATAAQEKALATAREQDRTHTDIQGWLRDLGMALGYDIWIAANDCRRPCGDGILSDGCLTSLPESVSNMPGAEAVRLIDVLWIARAGTAGAGRVSAAFEVEHTTSIYSGIVRLLDLALGGAPAAGGAESTGFFLVAPDAREADVRLQLARPAFSRITDIGVRYVPYSSLEEHRHAMARFGTGMKALDAVARDMR